MNAASPPLFTGCATALVTPFREGELDREAFVRLLHRQLEAGIDALVICGTTGESPTLTDNEKRWLFATASRESRRHAASTSTPSPPVIAGTGSNNTSRAVELSRMAADCGCDGLLVVTPYYNKASEAGLIHHYETVADATALPLILYHVPSRTGCRLTPSACRTLAAHPHIAGLKDASSDPAFAPRVRAACGDALPIYAGNDMETVQTLAIGGAGVISVVSNLYPARMVRLCRLFREGRAAEAAAEQICLMPLCDALFSEVNPIPVKYALSHMGLCRDEVRLPLAPAEARVRAAVDAVIE